MLSTIITATEHFCTHQIRSKYTIKDGVSKTRTLIAYIDIDTNTGQRHRVYVACDKNFIQTIATLFLDEVESDEETLMDMTLETANLIVGSAKVLAENDEVSYTINTPYFEKTGLFDFEYDQAKVISIGNNELTIAIKESNGY